MKKLKKYMTRKFFLKILIISLPYGIYLIRTLVQALDEFSQYKTMQTLKFFNLMEEPKKPNI